MPPAYYKMTLLQIPLSSIPYTTETISKTYKKLVIDNINDYLSHQCIRNVRCCANNIEKKLQSSNKLKWDYVT